MLEVEHPAAKVLVELAQLQDEEVGDGTTSVVIIAAELLKVSTYYNYYYFTVKHTRNIDIFYSFSISMISIVTKLP